MGQVSEDAVERVPACDQVVIEETMARYGYLFTTIGDPYGRWDWVEHGRITVWR